MLSQKLHTQSGGLISVLLAEKWPQIQIGEYFGPNENGLSQLENADELRRELQSPCWGGWARDGDEAAPWSASLGYLQPTAIPERSWGVGPRGEGTGAFPPWVLGPELGSCLALAAVSGLSAVVGLC